MGLKHEDIVTPRGSTRPLDPGHTAIGHPCPVCLEDFNPGDVLSVVLIRNQANVSLDNIHEHCAYEES